MFYYKFRCYCKLRGDTDVRISETPIAIYSRYNTCIISHADMAQRMMDENNILFVTNFKSIYTVNDNIKQLKP